MTNDNSGGSKIKHLEITCGIDSPHVSSLSMDHLHKLDLTRQNLDKVGPTFCLAKWLQLSLHLERGLGHSCHHPHPEAISVDAIKEDFLALHNSPNKMHQREQMLRGERPEACSYCWKVEGLQSGSIVSDRIIKSSAWVSENSEEIAKLPARKIVPRYIEVGFSNVCNLKCSYCSALYSSAWVAENSQHGGSLPSIKPSPKPLFEEDANPYIDAFWRLWATHKEQFETIRITGGEPLLSDSFWKMLDEFEANRLDHISLIINSNLMVGQNKLDALVSKLRSIQNAKNVKSIKIVTSLESDGAQAEYSRFGLRTEAIWKNIDILLEELPEIEVSITNTMQILAVTTYIDYLKKVLLRRQVGRRVRLLTDPIILKSPSFFSLEFLPQRLKVQFVQNLKQYLQETEKFWSKYELLKFEVLMASISQNSDLNLSRENQLQATEYFKLYDSRRKLSFSATFPDLREYYE